MRQVQESIDLERPLLAQVAGLGDSYDAWVHRSIRPRGSLRIFVSDGMERLSHIPWWLIPILWVPIAAGLFLGAVLGAGLRPGPAAAWSAGGLLAWTLIEYALHRWVFHWKPRSALGRRIHFLAHGVHHLDPWDPTRLVFPPAAGILVASGILGLYALLLPFGAALAAMSGTIAGYVVYDMTHYYTHHAKPRSAWGRFVKAYHLAHHHKHWERMFGVSQPLWDVVFRTGRPRE
jgi:dihydroceramide fatty acyl 2-hydroxylase